MNIDWTMVRAPGARAADEAARLRAMAAGLVQDRLDAWAQHLGYRDMISICSYVHSTVPEWREQAMAAIAWRDACWTAVYALEDSAAAPATSDELLAALPAPPDAA